VDIENTDHSIHTQDTCNKSWRLLIERSQPNIVLQLKRSLGISLPWDELHPQIVLDCKHGVIVKIFGVLVEDLRGNRLVALRLDLLFEVREGRCEIGKEHHDRTYNKMDVGGPPVMAIQHLKKLSRGAVVRNLV
jgi:hypothetical protein